MRCRVNHLNGPAISRGAGYIFIETIVGFISGYLLWLILTRITTPEIIGLSSTLVSLAGIFTAIATLGVPVGVSRFLAKTFHEKDSDNSKILVKVSVILVIIGILTSVTMFMIVKDWITSNLDTALVVSVILVFSSSAFGILLHSILIASLKTVQLPKIMVISSSFRTVMVIILVLAHAGTLGIVLGYSFYQILASIMLSFAIVGLLRRQNKKPIVQINKPFKTILIASVPSWIPKLITIFGSANLGTVIVFGSSGSTEAASYFLANTILGGIIAIVTPLYTIAYPALSAMTDNRKRFTWRIIKISMVILTPLSLSVIFYSHDIINLLGPDYTDASFLLEILMLTAIMGSLPTMIGQLLYAYDRYRQLLYLGLASSIPRTALYFVLVPLFGGMGAAISYVVGSIIGFVLCSIIAHKMGMIINWKELGLTVIVPLIPAFLFSYFQVNFILGIILTITTSLIAFLRFKILTRSDVEDSLNVLPKGIAKPLTIILDAVGHHLNKDY
jgi:O-antigen/teichoic acid export membrane protein